LSPAPGRCSGLRQTRHGWLAGALLAGLPTAVLAGACDTPVLGTLAGAERSRWEEFDARGQSLVRERGTLKMAGLRAVGHCAALDWEATLGRSQGARDYDGVSSTQQALQTQSALRAQVATLSAWLPLGAGWSVGSQLGYRQIRRGIAASGPVLGYVERFDQLQAALGGRYQAALGQSLRLAASGWLGGGPGGRVRVDLPQADPVALPLGRHRLLVLGLQLEGGEPLGAGWSWQAGLAYRREQTGAGDARALLRNGVPVGAALQPRIVQQHLGASAAAVYRF